MLFFKDKDELKRWLNNVEDSPYVMILQHFIAFVIAIFICMAIDSIFLSCRSAKETTTTTTNVEVQKDTTHSVLDTYDRVEIKDKSIYDTWYNFDSLLAHIRIIDFDTLGRPVRFVDADVQHGTAKGGNTTVKDKDSIKFYQAHADTTASTIREKESKESRVVTTKLQWWQRTSFRIAIAVIAAIIAILIAYLTRHRWLNRILSWLLHTK